MATIEMVKEYLNQVKDAKEKYVGSEWELEEIRETRNITTGYIRDNEKIHIKNNDGSETIKINSITRLKEHCSGGLKNDTSNLIIELEKEEMAVEQYKINWLRKRYEIKTFLNSIKMSKKIRDVLMLRYISIKKWEEIAVKLNLSYQRVQQLHSTGLNIIKNKLDMIRHN